MSPRPRVLVATWYRWPSAARFAAALVAHGAEVEVVCPDSHPILAVKGITKRYPFKLTSLSKSLANAIEASRADIVIPCDDLVLSKLRRAYGGSTAPALQGTRTLTTSPQQLDILLSRAALMEVAAAMGLPCPATRSVADQAELERWLDENGAPFFLKVDQSFGGLGVRFIPETGGAAAAFASIGRPPTAFDAIRRLLRRQDASQLDAWLRGTPPLVSAQAHVPGTPANCSAFAWGGEIRGIVCVEAVRTLSEFGVATVVRPVDNPVMKTAAAALAKRLSLNGVFGLDFVVDTTTGRTWLIELNGRPTPISHLNFGPGSDLVAAMLSAISDGPEVSRPTIPMGVDIALFPHCLRSDTAPDGAIDDLPLDQPALIRRFR